MAQAKWNKYSYSGEDQKEKKVFAANWFCFWMDFQELAGEDQKKGQIGSNFGQISD